MRPDRDRIIEQALKHELRDAGAPAGDAHLDAETLAAWTDGGLDATAMASAEAHVSVCARCQTLVGTLARTQAPTPGTLGTLGTQAPKAPWFYWLAPLAAGAAAVTIWMVVPQQQQLATAPPTPTAAEATQPRSASEQPVPAPPEERVARADKVEPPASFADQPRDNRAQPKERAELKQETEPTAQRARAATAADSAIGGAAPAAPPAPAPAAAAAESNAAPAVALQKSLAVAPLEIVSPDPARRWRVVVTGVEHSEDAGLTWIPVRPPSNESITGGTAVSRSICWLIGRSGLVLITVDGSTFARVDLPERVDVTAIAATDARTATVTTADGRRFRTDDSGRNWRPN
jgi:hypothetical protein